MKLEELALRTREEFEQELDKMYPLPENPKNPDEWDQVFEERVRIRQSITRLRVEALLDGKLTVDQVVDQLHEDNDEDLDLDLDGNHRGCLNKALEELKRGENREDIIDKTFNSLELL